MFPLITASGRRRRKKCDEEKPTCRRCRNDAYKCDGYAGNPSPKSSSLVAPQETSYKIPSFVLGDINYASTAERQFFKHFRQWTSSCPPESGLLLTEYVLPLAHQDESVKAVVAAVGAAYQYFIISHSPCSPEYLDELEKSTIHHYNRAISHILKRTSSSRPEDMLVIALSCLLFVCYEGMMGHDDELMKHLKAGLRILENSDEWKSMRDEPLGRAIAHFFGYAGVEMTIYTDDHLFDPIRYKALLPMALNERRPFADLQQASTTLKALDIEVLTTSGIDGPGCGPEFRLDPRVVNSFEFWNRRFELTVLGLDTNTLSRSELLRLKCLRLEQKLWLIMTEYSRHTYCLVWGIVWNAYLDLAEEVACLLTTGDAPTFSLDGSLVSGLSFAVMVAADADVKYRALSILQSLNRREGMWDSNELFKNLSAELAAGEHGLSRS